jgi:uncharacterized Fe-S cluster-containing protein
MYSVIRNRKMGYRIIQYIEELEDTTGVIKIRISKKNRQYIYQTFEDTTGEIRICNSRENRKYIYQKSENTTGVIRI